jgi:Lon protease-like protein
VVLLPGARMPLHIFEPRYRTLLADCLARPDRAFGLINCPEGTNEADLPPGRVGCHALIGEVEQLADGRANIVVTGGARFALIEIVPAPAPYRVARVTPFADVAEPASDVAALAAHARHLFASAAALARSIVDDPDPVPDLPGDDDRVAFAVGALIDMTVQARQELLSSSSACGRLRAIIALLANSSGELSARADAHARSKRNGRGPYPPHSHPSVA